MSRFIGIAGSALVVFGLAQIHWGLMLAWVGLLCLAWSLISDLIKILEKEGE